MIPCLMIRISVAKSSWGLRSGGATISLSRVVPANSLVKLSPSTSSRAADAAPWPGPLPARSRNLRR